MQTKFTVGIEEEFQIVDPETRDLRSSVTEILAQGSELLKEQIKKEMFQAMVEVGTEICDDVEQARTEVVRLRRIVGELAQAAGGRLVASGTHPFGNWQNMEITDDERYSYLTEQLQEIARSIAVYGLHVHVGVDDRDQSIELMNEARYFLPHILALSVNSPFWEGRDTGIKSYRSVIWGRMPRSGIPDSFRSWDDYRSFVDMLIATHSIDEPKKIWWDIRPHPKFNTLEFRVCDMPTRVEETVALAALFQAVVAKLSRLRSRNLGFRIYQRSLIAENRWRAMRFGIDGKLIDFGKGCEVPMRELGEELLEFVDDVVDDLGSRQAIETVHHILRHGTGADRQLAVYERTRDLRSVVDFLADETMRGVVPAATAATA
jgi:glutamate---cysteine ligase / carboxylate-amine ligase